jgi:L-asparaginase / beta-aspartyl-peptidase
MKYLFFFLTVIAGSLTISCSDSMKTKSNDAPQPPEWAIVVHGGAGYMRPGNYTEADEMKYKEQLEGALFAGAEILENGGSSLAAVEAAIRLLEDSPLFNAGRGAVFNAEGVNELDASIMEGKTLNAGAVANVSTIKNPISAARKVMEDSPHVMLIKEGAETFAQENGLEMVDPSWFFTQKSWDALQRAKESEKSGTVGCVALDKEGNIAAGTSTGGMTNKKWGRVGDSPVIGAGTYADNNTCGVSATGHGEFFIRNVVAYDIAARMKYLNEALQSAADDIINNKLKSIGANGGVIAMDKYGNIAMPFNTSGMFRGYLKAGEKPKVLIYREDK